MLWRLNEAVAVLAFLATFVVAAEGGFRLGKRHADRSDEFAKTHIAGLQTALIGLLALLLGFTFFLAASRFEERKALVVEEANAIGTVALRAEFLPADQFAAVRELLRAQVAARIAFHAAGIDPSRIAQANNDAARIERDLWVLVLDATVRDPRSVPVGLFVESVNTVIDLRERRQVALDNHVPETVLYLLLTVAGVAFGSIGYACGLTRLRRTGSTLVFALLIAFVLAMILDIDRPRRGFITVPQESMLRLQATLASDP